jgi:hypothetical protein
VAGAVANAADGEHDRYFHQNSDYRRQGGSRPRTEKSDGGGDRQLVEIAGSNERSRSCHRMRNLDETHQSIGQGGSDIPLQKDKDRDRDQDYIQVPMGKVVG